MEITSDQLAPGGTLKSAATGKKVNKLVNGSSAALHYHSNGLPNVKLSKPRLRDMLDYGDGGEGDEEDEDDVDDGIDVDSNNGPVSNYLVEKASEPGNMDNLKEILTSTDITLQWKSLKQLIAECSMGDKNRAGTSSRISATNVNI